MKYISEFAIVSIQENELDDIVDICIGLVAVKSPQLLHCNIRDNNINIIIIVLHPQAINIISILVYHPLNINNQNVIIIFFQMIENTIYLGPVLCNYM